MEIEFGWCLDGAAWADGTGATGQVRMGPRGLVQLLQTRLGLTHPPVEAAVRIAQYSRAVAAADHPWTRDSFAVDPWGTARALLRLRDATIGEGWDPCASTGELPERLDALRAIEQRIAVGVPGAVTAPDEDVVLAPGAADDLAEVLALLEDLDAVGASWPLGIDAVCCHEDPAVLPGLWPRLFALLNAAGAPTSVLPEATTERAEMVVVEADDEWTAAEAAARYLAGAVEQEPDGAAGGLHVLATDDTVILDQELRRRGLPAVGAAEASADRAALQILPLFLSIAIAPVDVHQLGAFLDMRVLDPRETGREPIGLIPPRARQALLDALAQQPGVGGPAWRHALSCLERAAEGADEQSRPAASHALETARAIDALVSHPIPAEQAAPARLRETTDWLSRRLRALGQGDPALSRALSHLQVFHEVLASLPSAQPLSARDLAQILEATGGRATSPFSTPEACPAWTARTDPAQLRADGGTVLWWGANRRDPGRAAIWDVAETAALTAAGAHVLDPSALAALTTDAQLRGLHGAGRIVAVRTTMRHQEPTSPSGLLAHLAAERAGPDRRSVAEVLESATVSPTALLGDHVWQLAGVRHRVTNPAPSPPADGAGVFSRTDDGTAPVTDDGTTSGPEDDSTSARDLTKIAGPAPHLIPRSLSYSQAENLIGCRQKWTYRSGLGIAPASVADVPTGNRMIGTLIHAVVERVIEQAQQQQLIGPPGRDRITAAFTELVPRYASELLLPGREVELTTIRREAVRSLEGFFSRLAAAGLVITGVESGFDKPLRLRLAGGDVEVPFRGFRDVVAEDAEGRPTVIDLKWTWAAKKYPDLLDTGEALQLASYAWSLHEDEHDGDRPAPAGVAYFLLKQGEFVSDSPQLDPNGRETFDVDAAWGTLVEEVTEALDAIAGGTVSAASGQLLLDEGSGLHRTRRDNAKLYAAARTEAREHGGIMVDARCDYCDFSLLCGMNEDAS